jgi:beta-phosphoglucomutase-like phosphatase (HAD superfamily)
MVKAVVFDFDGVIANSEPLHFRAYRDVLADVDVMLPESEYYERYLGYDDRGAFRAIAADRGLRWADGFVSDLVRRKAIRMEVLEREHSVLFPGAGAAIRRLADRFPLAIASGALGAEIRRVLERESLDDAFTVLVAAEDTPASKPAPDPYVRAVALLAERSAPLEPDECVAIEDSVWGLESARTAGLRTIAVSHTYPAESLAALADVVIDRLEILSVEFVSRIGR